MKTEHCFQLQSDRWSRRMSRLYTSEWESVLPHHHTLPLKIDVKHHGVPEIRSKTWQYSTQHVTKAPLLLGILIPKLNQKLGMHPTSPSIIIFVFLFLLIIYKLEAAMFATQGCYESCTKWMCFLGGALRGNLDKRQRNMVSPPNPDRGFHRDFCK